MRRDLRTGHTAPALDAHEPNNLGSGDTDHDNGGYQMGRTSSAAGGSETRPLNANVNYIIKY